MSNAIGSFPSPPAGVRMAAGVMQVIGGDCAARYPEEACGILIGRADGNELCITEARPAANVWDEDDEKKRRYLIDPHAQLAAERDAAAAGLAVIGFYHSHPDAAPVPSERDRAAAWPVYVYLIVNVTTGEVGDAQLWALEPAGEALVPVPLRIV